MKTIAIASKNPVKIRAVKQGFEHAFPEGRFVIEAIATDSGVADQPLTDEETLTGAQNRAEQAAIIAPQADYWVGVEGGIEDHPDGMQAFAWVVVKSAVQVGRGRTGAFYLPYAVSELVREGMELGEADDIVFGKNNSKQAEGAVGLLTGGVIDRASLYMQAVILALIPFKNVNLYNQNGAK